MHVLAQQSGLVDAIDQYVDVLKAEHVRGLAYNVLCGGTCCKRSSCDARMRCIWTPWARNGFPTDR